LGGGDGVGSGDFGTGADLVEEGPTDELAGEEVFVALEFGLGLAGIGLGREQVGLC
jgi:hypothetical protein